MKDKKIRTTIWMLIIFFWGTLAGRCFEQWHDIQYSVVPNANIIVYSFISLIVFFMIWKYEIIYKFPEIKFRKSEDK